MPSDVAVLSTSLWPALSLHAFRFMLLGGEGAAGLFAPLTQGITPRGDKQTEMSDIRPDNSTAAKPVDCARQQSTPSGDAVDTPRDDRISLADRVEKLERLLGTSACRQLGIYRLPKDFLLSVVIPVYNEVETVAEVIRRVRATRIPTQMILVDDASTDGTRQQLQQMLDAPDLDVVLKPRNEGKGAAIKTGFARVRGDVVVIQDADLEYDPADFWKMLQPIVSGQADAVFGSRLQGSSQRVLYFWHYVGNWFLTLLSNFRTNLNLSDMETCYKMLRREVVEQITPALREKRFGIEPELIAKVAKIPGIRVFELPISYNGRTYADGKKIGWRDGVRAIWCILRY